MSEHTKGRLHQCSHSDKRLRDESGAWVAATDTVRRSESECTANSRRLTACWNNAEGMETKEIEQGMPLVKVRDKINAQARELAAARALLREVVAMDMLTDPFGAINSRIRSYLDACDTLGSGND